MHYARMAPLEGVTRQVRDLNDTKPLGNIVEELKGDIASIKSRLPDLDSQTHKLLELEVRIANSLDQTLDTGSVSSVFPEPRSRLRRAALA